jgi:hypothetical protein
LPHSVGIWKNVLQSGPPPVLELELALLLAALLLAELLPVPGMKHLPIEGWVAGASHAAIVIGAPPPVPPAVEVELVVFEPVVVVPVVFVPDVVVLAAPPSFEVPAPVDVVPVVPPPHARGKSGATAATTRIQEYFFICCSLRVKGSRATREGPTPWFDGMPKFRR